jgi:hypothetical protein
MDPRLRLVSAALALGLGGCSFAFVHGPPANHRQMRFFDCSTSNALPLLDSVMAAGAVGETLDAVTGSATTMNKTELATFAVEAAILGASAVYGFTKTSDCRDAQAAMLARTPLTPVGPYMLAPPVDPWTNRSIQAAPPPPPPSQPAPDPER